MIGRLGRGSVALFARTVALGAAPAAVALLACAPARRVLAVSQAPTTAASVQYFLGGLLGDVATYAVPALVVLALAAPLIPREPSRRRHRLLPNVTAAVIGALAAGAYLFSLGVTEFRLQRGTYPVLSELRAGLSASDGVVGALPVLLSPRYLPATLLAFALLVPLVLALPRLLRALAGHRGTHLAAPALGVALSAAAFSASARAERWLPALNHAQEIASPLPDVVHDLVGKGDTVSPDKIRPVVATFKGTAEEVRLGAHAYGFGDEAAEALAAPGDPSIRCNMHPLRQPLDPEDPEAEAPMLRAARRLSWALFEGRAVDPILWQIGVESFRAEDVHALNPAAPAAITPHTNRWYGDVPKGHAREGDAGAPAEPTVAIPFRHVHQTGVRTAQAHSSLMCGFGYLPFNMALVRDLGNVPLRCLPDVLSDAGFAPTAYYGHDFAFDNEGTFFRFHGVALIEKNHLPESDPHGAWGAITDAPLYAHAEEDARRRKGPQYNFVATLASHMPYDLPKDLPKELEARVAPACKSPKELGVDDCHRIKTLAYADETAAAFVARVATSERADRTLILLSADHSTNDNFVWDTVDRAGSYSRIPMVLHVPEAALAAAAHPSEAREAVAALRSLAATRPLSNADVPSFVLALLAETAPVRALPARWRWHTLAGQTVRRAFRAPVGLRPAAMDEVSGPIALFGVNAPAHMFWGDADGVVHDTEARNTALATTADVETPPTHARPPLAFLAAFLQGYGAACTDARWLRADVRPRTDGLTPEHP